MNCADWEEKLNADLDGELPAGERGALEAHLAACAECRRAREALRAQTLELEAAVAPDRERAHALAPRIAQAARALPRPRSAHRPALLLGAGAAAAAIAAPALFSAGPHEGASPAPVEAPVAAISARTGPVLLGPADRPGGGPDRPLQRGDRVRTSAGSLCEIACRDGTLLRLAGSTDLELKGPGALRLQGGELFARTDRARCRVECPEGTLVMAPGSEVDLVRVPELPGDSRGTPSTTTFSVLRGSASMVGDHTRRDVRPGMACTVEKSEPGEEFGIDPTEATAWSVDLLKLRPKGDPEVARRVGELARRICRTKSPEAYEREIRAFGDRSAPALLELVRHPPAELNDYDRRAAARMLSFVAGRDEVGALVELSRDADPEVRTFSSNALIRVTGARLKGAVDWDRWYREHRDAWPSPEDPLKPNPKKG